MSFYEAKLAYITPFRYERSHLRSISEIIPPPTPNSEIEEETDQNGHPGLEEPMDQDKPLTPVPPEPEEATDPLADQDPKNHTSPKEDSTIRRPSTIFSPVGDGNVVSPWGPPTKFVLFKVLLFQNIS